MAELSSPSIPFSTDSFDEFLASRDEPGWLLDVRKAAWDQFRQMDWPSRKHEEWIRTDIRLFHLDRFAPASPSAFPDSAPSGLLSEGLELAGQTRSWNSAAVESHQNSTLAEQGVIFGSWSEVLAEHGETLRPYLERPLIEVDYDKFSALQAAYWTGGSVLYVPRSVVVDQPIHLLSLLEDGSTDLGRTLIILEDDAEATILQETDSLSPDHGGFHCGTTEMLCGQNARLRFVNLQNWGHKVWHFAHQRARLQRDARLQWTTAAMGARLAKVNQQVQLAGPGAESQVNGVLFTEGRQHSSCHTLQHHQAPDCRSDFLYKSALQDTSRTVWRGMIKVDSEAQRTDGYQRNDNLLLSTRCRADSIPGLEIEADDVRCTHGSTTSKVDEELIFYAQCRGFTRREATRAIVIGFFQQIFDRVTIKSVRDALGHAIARRVREYD